MPFVRDPPQPFVRVRKRQLEHETAVTISKACHLYVAVVLFWVSRCAGINTYTSVRSPIVNLVSGRITSRRLGVRSVCQQLIRLLVNMWFGCTIVDDIVAWV